MDFLYLSVFILLVILITIIVNYSLSKTNATYCSIIERLAIIDNAQQKIKDLSSSVLSLQEILIDKRARGAFGEIQLEYLIKNLLPSNNYSFQKTLSNNTRADCILYLPEPTGNIVIDSKFPLESYQKMTSFDNNEFDKNTARQQFKQDIKTHILAIAQKYILPGETADSAIMFLPAEAIFAEIHHNYPELVQLSFQRKIWITSPTTMMAILTTASSVIKDTARKKHIQVIQTHIIKLADDFNRFMQRMDKLAKHIEQANQDVNQVNISAKKIHSRFTEIEKAESLPEA